MNPFSLAERDGGDACQQAIADREYRLRPAELQLLKTIIDSPTVGVAFFDRDLNCRILNSALAAMDIVSLGEHVGKSIHEIFGSSALELETTLRRVLGTKHNFSDVQLTLQEPGTQGTRRWSVNFYAIKDDAGQVWLVAITFSETTKRSRAALHLGRAARFCRNAGDTEPSLLGDEMSALLAKSLRLARRSVELMDDSIYLRFYVSETRMETGLEPLHLFLTSTRSHESIRRNHWTLPVDGPDNLESAAPVESTSALKSGLSPRERQVLNLLAGGKSNKEIGSALAISTRTVETYRARLMKKLELHSTADLVRYAIRNKFIDA